MVPAHREKDVYPHFALLSVQFFFGSLPVIAKVVLATIPAVALVGFRVGITAVILIIVQISRGHFWLEEKRDYWRLAVLSLFGVTFNQLLFITGLSLTKASNTSLLAVTIPIFALAIGAIIGTESLRGRKVIGIVIAAIGVIVIIDPRNAWFSSQTSVGDMLIVLNSFCFGTYVATSKAVVTQNGAFRSMMWVFIFAAVVCVPLGFYSMNSVDFASVGPPIWWIIAYIAIGATATPYLLNAWALARVNPSTVAVYIYLQPLIGFLLAVIFLGEHIGLQFILATFLIFGGVYLVTKRFVPVET